MKSVFAIFVLYASVLSPTLGLAQGLRYQSQISTNGLPNPVVRICTEPASGSPCTPLANIFTDKALTNPSPNPFSGDAQGNFFFYADGTTTCSVATACHIQIFENGVLIFEEADVVLAASGGGGVTISGTPYQVSRFTPAGNNIQDSSGSDNPANGYTQWPNGLTVMGAALGLVYPNSPNGTAVQLLACIDPSVTAVSEITTCPSGTTKAVGLIHSGGGVTGNAQVSQVGFDSCIFDGQTVIGDYAGPSTSVDGECADLGSSPSGVGQRVGRVTTINSGAGTASTLQLGPWDLFAPGSGGGSGTVSACATANSNALFVAAGATVNCDGFVTDDSAGNMTMFSLGLVDTAHAGFYYQKQGPAPPATPANSIAEYPPTSVTAYAEKRPGTVGTVGQTRVITSIGTDGGGNPIAIEGWGTAGGTSLEVQTNGVDNASQALLNFINGNASFGYSVNPVNPSGGQERLDVTTPFTQISTPSAPTLTTNGSAGSTSYSYKVVGCEDGSACAYHTAASSVATITTGNATIDSTNSINIKTYADTLYGPRCYNIYRTASTGSPATTGLIANCVWKSFIDTGIAGDSSSAPTTNTTKLDPDGNFDVVNPCTKRPTAPAGVDGLPCVPKTLDDEFTSTFGNPGDANSPFWAWVNQNGAVATLTNGLLTISNSPSSDQLNCLVETAPAAPYTFVAVVYVNVTPNGNMLGNVIFRESSTSKMVAMGVQIQNSSNSSRLQIVKWTNATTPSSTPVSGAASNYTNPIYLKIQNDGTNTIYSTSPDGVEYALAFSEAKNAFFTTAPNQVGMCLEPAAGTGNASYDFWRETQ